MMKFMVLSLVTLATTAMAIEFITEEDVSKKLKAEKVIEVSKYKIELEKESKACEEASQSRSGRAYVVKIGKKVSFYRTPSGLDGLIDCGELL